jgi:hypothetical protein
MEKAKRPRGRPPLSGESGQRYQVHLPPSVADKLREYGDGSLSQGIVRAARLVCAMTVTPTTDKQLDKVLDFYRKQADFVGGRKVPVMFTEKAIEKFAKRIDPFDREYEYRGFTLVRLDPK